MATTKRKHEDYLEEDTLIKKSKVTSEESNILTLSDCTLLILLSYLDATALYFLSQTCRRFKYLVKDTRLWRYIDARRPPNTLEKVRYCEKRINERTTHIHFSAESRCREIISNEFFTIPHIGEHLCVLALENQYINGHYFPLRMYPQTLQELSLRKSFVSGGNNFFRFAKNMESLRVLILDHCLWVETYNLLSIANLKNLEILSFYMCKKLSDTNIGYISVSGIYGFKNLKILNARFTGLGNQLLSSFYRSPSLQELYFQGYCTTYQLERSERKLQILNGDSMREYSYLSEDEENYDTSEKYLNKRFGPGQCSTNKMDVLDDVTIFTYKHVQAYTEELQRPKSLLFRDPYDECKCGFYKNFWNVTPEDSTTANFDPSSSSDDEDNHRKKKLKKQIKKRKRQLKKMIRTKQVPPVFFKAYYRPAFISNYDKSRQDNHNPNYKESTPSDVNFEWIYHREPINEFEVAQLEHSMLNRALIDTTQVLVLDVHNGQTNQPLLYWLPRNQNENNNVQNSAAANSNTSRRNRDVSKPSTSRKNESSSDSSDDEGSVCYSSDQDGPEAARAVAPDLQQNRHLRITFRDSPDNKIKSRIRKMSLRGFPKITDSSLSFLNGLKIELLDVQYTNVTAKGVRQFMIEHPECRVIHESACVCGPRMHF